MVTFDSLTTISAISLTLCATREDCREQVVHHSRAVYKKMKTLDEAEGWIKGDHADDTVHPTTSDPEIEPADSLPSLSQTSVGSSPPASSSSTISPTPTAGLGSESPPHAGRSNTPLRARVGTLKRTSSSSSSKAFEDVVYTDGACSRNGQAGSVAGIGVWWGPNDPRCVFSRLLASNPLTASRVQKPLRALSGQPTD